MSPDLNQPASSALDTVEPRIERTAIPIWLIILLFILFYWGMVYFDLHGAWFDPHVYAPYRSTADLETYRPPPASGCDLARGKAIYESNCGLCHNIDGMGKPGQAPRLVGSEWVLGNSKRFIRIPLLGLTGPIQVAGERVLFPSGMAAMGSALSDDDLATILCYIRKSWGNNGSEITSEQVRAVRAELGGRFQPNTEEELLKLPEK